MSSRTKPAPDASRRRPTPVSITRGQSLERVIFSGGRKPMTRRDLHVALEPIIRPWIEAACTWETPEIGDYRFVVFSIDVGTDTNLYVQLWSEPMEEVLWEVSSGRWNPPADEWLAGERAQRIEALGFEIGGTAENYQRDVRIASPADIAAVAKQIVEIFYQGFDYRGTQPIRALLVHEGRSEMNATFGSFTPEDIAKVFTGLGFRVQQWEDDDGEPQPLLRCRKRGTMTIVELGDQVGEENLYERVRFSADVELPDDERQRLKDAPDAPPGTEPVASLSVVHPFSGGVTLAWLIARIQEWDAVLAEHRRLARRSRRAGRANASGTIH